MRARAARLLAAALLAAAATPAGAANPMGYRLLTQQEAATLPHNHGALGMDIERARHIEDDGLAFDLIGIKTVRAGTPGAQAGFHPGDSIIAVDGRAFASLAAFAAYVGAQPPGTAIRIDTIPAGGGPAQAQRITATVGQAGRAASPAGLSTGTKIAIGVGAAALLYCYERNCLGHHNARDATPPPASNPPPPR